MKPRLAWMMSFALLLPALAWSQDKPTPKKYDHQDWYSVVDVQYKAGKMEDALKMIREKFIPAGEKAGIPGPTIMVNHSGRWDLTFVWYMRDGISGMEWEVKESDIQWMSALAEMEGGMEGAQKLMGEYTDLVADFDRRIMRKIYSTKMEPSTKK